MSEYKSCEAIIAEIQRTMDMQDLYLPVHFIELLNDVPAADVKPVLRARWEICSDGYYPFCSNCRNEPQGRSLTDFCPNCGADMRGQFGTDISD